MGPSGSGKTTVLDLLAGRKTVGTMEGTILFSGNKPTRNFLRRCTGYVEQFGELNTALGKAALWKAAFTALGKAALHRLEISTVRPSAQLAPSSAHISQAQPGCNLQPR
jgi:ABC-type bacteriocin/lantibiotic exporter with double-glycine peptidase domain